MFISNLYGRENEAPISKLWPSISKALPDTYKQKKSSCYNCFHFKKGNCSLMHTKHASRCQIHMYTHLISICKEPRSASSNQVEYGET